MDGLFTSLADSLGASVDQIKLITCLLVSYPLGSVFVRVPSVGLKHVFNISVTLLYLLAMLNMFNAFLQLLLDILVTYYLAKGMTDKRMPWLVFIFVMGHLLINHIIRAFFDLSYETVEVTGPQMVLVMKLTTFAWNVYDGRRSAEELDKWQLERRVTDQKFPSLLAFLGYTFYFPGFLVGPFLEYAEYDALVTEKLFKSATPPRHLHDPSFVPKRLLPSGRKRVGYFKLVTGLVYLGLFVTLYGKFSFAETLKPWFGRITLVERLFFFQIAGFFERCKYYAIWTLTEGAAIITGLGFTGYNDEGRTLWDGAANIRVLNIEFAENFKMLLDSWNMKTNVWLRECIYKRVAKKGAKPGFKSSMMTFTVSAIWHGVSPGYYLTFVFGGFVTTAARLVRSAVRPLLIPVPGQPTTSPSFNKRIYDWSGVVLTAMLMNYAAAPFMLLTVENTLKCFSRVAWYGYIIVGGSLFFFYAGGTRALKRAQAKRVKNYQDRLADEKEREREREESVNGTIYETEGGSGAATPSSSDETHVVPPIALVAEEFEKHHEKIL
ncbi:MBOAT-domain-containing protein [Thelephora ganbajun]|uniref:MBOAT-domain-containing protein n=1 Tax=Thelephora ganbajun TaxID=370292 RepID=A0ACB6ZJC1_THEGA|nr:MBOAT-domain-containing protein [Thelephora ganbajun]